MARYNESIFRKAEAVLRKRKEAAEQEQRIRRAEEFMLHPELKDVCLKLESTSSRYLKIVLEGGKDYQKKIEQLKQETLKLNEQKRAMLFSFTGDPEYLNARYTCPLCEDSGYKEGVRCDCMNKLLKKIAADEFVEKCGIKLCDFSDFDPNLYPDTSDNGLSPREKMMKLFNFCRSYCEGFGLDSHSLFFMGKTGLGKTFLSSCIAKEVLEKGNSVIIGQFATFMRRIEDEHFGRAEGNTLDSLVDCDLLILDDLGSEFRTIFTESALYEIVNGRINANKPTIMSTNLSAAELNNTYNERLISRITGCFVPCIFYGNDVRPMLRRF